ncbi:cell division cycle protein 20 homolog B-like [Amia ocellicauda]|uniref:cell division cycle protein 20 homolog B-like n=1 Tax=Amia ocellicauda TaxID=2972642 RepID=UPI003463DED7
MDWKLERYSRFKIKTEDAMRWETIMSILAKDFTRTRRHYPFRMRKTADGASISYSRFKSRIMKKLSCELPVASSPDTTRWQHSCISENDTVCQKLPLDLSPEGSSKSQLTLEDDETTLISEAVTYEIKKKNHLASDTTSARNEEHEAKKQKGRLKGCAKMRMDSENKTSMRVNFIKDSSNTLGHLSGDNTPLELDLKLDIAGLQNNYYLNLLDWNSANLVALALDASVFIWNAETHTLQDSFHLKTESTYISSVSWIRDGNVLAIGTSDGEVQLWDTGKKKRLRNMLGHLSVVGALSWNNHILSSGSLLGVIHHHDVRIANHHVGTLRHRKSICGLQWSPNGGRLASGSSDGLLNIWPYDSIKTAKLQPLQSISHPTAVKAMGWCPWQTEVVAVGGGVNDGVLRIWDTNTGKCLQSAHTHSQICSLLWTTNTKELITGHGLPHNQIAIWDFPYLTKRAEVHGHKGRVLNLAISPCGRHIFSAGSDEMACVWRNRGQEERLQEHIRDTE